MHAYIHACMHTYIHTCMNACMRLTHNTLMQTCVELLTIRYSIWRAVPVHAGWSIPPVGHPCASMDPPAQSAPASHGTAPSPHPCFCPHHLAPDCHLHHEPAQGAAASHRATAPPYHGSGVRSLADAHGDIEAAEESAFTCVVTYDARLPGGCPHHLAPGCMLKQTPAHGAAASDGTTPPPLPCGGAHHLAPGCGLQSIPASGKRPVP